MLKQLAVRYNAMIVIRSNIYHTVRFVSQYQANPAKKWQAINEFLDTCKKQNSWNYILGV